MHTTSSLPQRRRWSATPHTPHDRLRSRHACVDTAGLIEPELKVLKTIGALNLIAVGGSLRASRSLVRVAVLDRQRGTGSPDAVDKKIIDDLVDRGLITYREFVDEYRIWSAATTT